MLSAAYSQIGITQDCTAMVEKALGAAGIPVGDLGPQQFMNYGKVVADPQPGDMIVQSGHVAIYAGNGQAISGGMNGSNQTISHPHVLAHGHRRRDLRPRRGVVTAQALLPKAGGGCPHDSRPLAFACPVRLSGCSAAGPHRCRKSSFRRA